MSTVLRSSLVIQKPSGASLGIGIFVTLSSSVAVYETGPILTSILPELSGVLPASIEIDVILNLPAQPGSCAEILPTVNVGPELAPKSIAPAGIVIGIASV